MVSLLDSSVSSQASSSSKTLYSYSAWNELYDGMCNCSYFVVVHCGELSAITIVKYNILMVLLS